MTSTKASKTPVSQPCRRGTLHIDRAMTSSGSREAPSRDELSAPQCIPAWSVTHRNCRCHRLVKTSSPIAPTRTQWRPLHDEPVARNSGMRS